MPIYDLTCDLHDPPIRLLDLFLESWRSPNPPCPACAAPTERVWSTSLASDASRFGAFDTWANLGDGQGERRVEVRSIADVRRIETQTRRAWEAGFPNSRPIAFRIYNQDEGRGGRFVNCFGEAPKIAGTFRTRGRDGQPFVTHKDVSLTMEELMDLERSLPEPIYSPDFE
jgi:hypothetical protein